MVNQNSDTVQIQPPHPVPFPRPRQSPPTPPLRQQWARNPTPASPTLNVQQEVKSNRKCGDPRQAGVSESTKEEQMQTFIFRVEFNPLTLHIPSTVSDTVPWETHW